MTEYTSKNIILRNKKDITLRSLQCSDVDSYLKFVESIAIETYHTLLYKGQLFSLEKLHERFQASLNSPWQMDLCGFENDRLVSHLFFSKTRPHHHWEKHTLEFGIKILREYCALGLGSKMLIIMESVASQMEVKRIQATVRTTNLKGINFYKKHGYEIEGEKKQDVLINGIYENEYYIAKILK